MSYLLSVFSSAKSAGEADGDRAAAIAETAATTSCGRENRSGAGVRLSSALPPQQGGHVSRRLFPWDLGHEDEGSEIGDEPLHGDTVSDDGHPSAGQPLTPPSRGKRGNVDGRAMVNRKTSDAFNNEDALLQEGYARIVACALAAEFAASSTLGKEDEEGQQQQRICKTRTGTSTVARCRTTPRHDHSASATVSELLRFFTLESTPRHEPEY
ncbi:hypothetical protein, unknown function [Leishmania tarentolae]|uniref:Uncharacterized protein n=1 Tax=Leishmania tarentolae TaxID=5689 RepID=A0A640KBF7_LEITA|nr:hypothetical protein, unknown function [Leishmania tarentolae]